MQQVQTLLNRPRFYYNIDGVGEISIGLMLLCFLFFMWMQIHSPMQSFWNRPYALLLYVTPICLAFHFGLKAFKQKITYRRTGFVRYKATPIWYLLASAVAAAATVLFIAEAGRHLFETASVLRFLFSLLMASCYGYGMARAVPWKWLVAAAIALSGAIVALLPAASVQPLVADSLAGYDVGIKLLVAYFLVWTPLFLLSGSISLVLYLRGTHDPAQDKQ